MTSEKIDRNHKDLKKIKGLYESSFPVNERIPFRRLINTLTEDRIMSVYHEDDKLVGMSFVFILNDLVYLSYISVFEELREQGYGSKILKKIISDFEGKRFVLDIEEVKTDSKNYEERRLRKDFYLKNGFESTGVFYHIYSVDYELLSYGGTVSREQWHELIRKHWGPFADSAVYRNG